MKITLNILHWLSRCFLGGVFIYSGFIKIADTLQFAVAIMAYKLAPEKMVLPLATYLPWIELILGVLLILCGWKNRYISMAISAIVLIFIVATMRYGLAAEKMALPLAAYLPWLELILGALLILYGWKKRYVSMAISAVLFFGIAAIMWYGLAPEKRILPLAAYFSGATSAITAIGNGLDRQPLTTYLPWIVLLQGVLLVNTLKIRDLIHYVSMAISAILLFFIAVLTLTYFRGIEANCGCFSFNDRITPLTILRDSLILLPAVYLAIEDRIRRRWQGSTSAAQAPNAS